MAFIDGIVVNVALPAIQVQFHTGFDVLQWVVNGYALILGALILMGGVLGDRYGRRRIFMTGIVLFALASIACAMAPSAGALIAARVLQGLGGALLVPQSLAIIAAAYPQDIRGRAVGIWAAAAAPDHGVRACPGRHIHRSPVVARGLLDQPAAGLAGRRPDPALRPGKPWREPRRHGLAGRLPGDGRAGAGDLFRQRVAGGADGARLAGERAGGRACLAWRVSYSTNRDRACRWCRCPFFRSRVFSATNGITVEFVFCLERGVFSCCRIR